MKSFELQNQFTLCSQKNSNQFVFEDKIP